MRKAQIAELFESGADDLVAAEESLLRLTLLDHLNASVSAATQGRDWAAYVEATRAINIYLDDELRHAFATYTEAVVAPRVIDISKPFYEWNHLRE